MADIRVTTGGPSWRWPAAAPQASRPGLLRQKVGEFVGITFYGALLRAASKSPLKAKYGHGGHGEDAFRSQLNLELARRAGRAGNLGIDEAIYRRLATARHDTGRPDES